MNKDQRIIELETKVTYLENYINQLNEVVIGQEKTIKDIISEIANIRKQIASSSEPLPANEKPPHY